MEQLHRCVFVVVAVALTGCAAMIQKTNEFNTSLVAAADIDTPTLVKQCTADATIAQDNKACVSSIVGDSESKCAAFMNGLVLTENSVNTGFDMATTLLSALATVFSPLNTVHALTASATVAGGWKSAISANVYAKAGVANYAQAIQSTYYRNIQDYIATLEKMDATQVNVWTEAAKLKTIHAQCSLASAQNAISATIQPTTPPATSAVITQRLTILKKAQKDETLILMASSPMLPPPRFVIVRVKSDGVEDEKTLAAAMLAAINDKKNGLSAARVEAVATTPASPSITLRSSADAAVIWSTTNPNVIELALPEIPSAASAGAASVDSGVTTRAVVPGSRI